jgi:hypothetical protein
VEKIKAEPAPPPVILQKVAHERVGHSAARGTLS